MLLYDKLCRKSPGYPESVDGNSVLTPYSWLLDSWTLLKEVNQRCCDVKAMDAP